MLNERIVLLKGSIEYDRDRAEFKIKIPIYWFRLEIKNVVSVYNLLFCTLLNYIMMIGVKTVDNIILLI